MRENEITKRNVAKIYKTLLNKMSVSYPSVALVIKSCVDRNIFNKRELMEHLYECTELVDLQQEVSAKKNKLKEDHRAVTDAFDRAIREKKMDACTFRKAILFAINEPLVEKQHVPEVQKTKQIQKKLPSPANNPCPGMYIKEGVRLTYKELLFEIYLRDIFDNEKWLKKNKLIW